MRTGPRADGLVTSPDAVVTLDYADIGMTYPAVESVSISRSLPSNLPAQVVGGDGITAATGTVTWAPPEAVRDTDVSPWRSADLVPLPGRPVQVSMTGDIGLSGGYPVVFTGEVEDTDGATGSSVSSSLVDHVYARFSQRVSIAPKARWMYPPVEAAEYRRVGLTYVYVVDAVLRQCDYYTTPPTEFAAVVSVPCQGTVWPAIGHCLTAGAQPGSPNSHASFFQADGRLYAGDFEETITPADARPVTDGVQISLTVGDDHGTTDNGTTGINVNYGSNVIRLAISSTGSSIFAYWNGATVVSTASGARGKRISLCVTPEGNWTLRFDTGQLFGGTQAVTGATPMSSVTVDAEVGARVAGIQVSHPNTPARQHASLSFTQTAHIRPGTISHGLLEAHRAINSETALDVLLEIARAVCASMWLDEDGIFQWAGPGVLRGQSPVTTVQARDSLLSLAWRVSLDHVRASTTVEWERCEISRSRWPKITFYDGRNESLVIGDELNDFIEVPSGEDWLGVHLPAIYAGANTGGDERVNRGIGSVMGGAGINTAGDANGVWFSPTYGSASIERFTHDKFLYKMAVTSLPGGGESFATQMSPGGGGLWPKWDGQSLPILRGYIKASWAKTDVRCQNFYFGDLARPHLTHDGGQWLSQGPGHIPFGDGDLPGRLADWIQQQCQTPQVEVTSCEIMPDPRIQLGDVINVADPDNLAVQIRALVTGISLSQSGPDMSMNLSLAVIAATPTAVTYAEFEDAWAGADYAEFEDAWAGSTYAEFEANPLEGAPNLG